MEALVVTTPRFRVSYPNLLRPRLNDLSGKQEYSVVALFPKGTDLSALSKACEAAVVKKWGSDKTKWPKGLRIPMRDQSEREKEGVLPEGHEAGAKFLNLKSERRPGLVNQQVQQILEDHEIYAGCYAVAVIGAYAYDVKGNKGVSFGLRHLQKVAEGEPMSGATRPEDHFKPIEDAASGASADSMFT